MKVQVLYFAALREKVGQSSENITLADDGATVESVLQLLRARGGVWQDAFSAENTIKCAVNRQLCGKTTPLDNDAEVALFPPLTGG